MERRAYLSILEWPDGMSEDRRVECVVQACGLDPFVARQRVVRGTPQVTTTIDVDVASHILDALRERHILAIAPTEEDLAAIPAPFRAKRLIRPEGAPRPMYMVEPWRGSPEGLVCDDVMLIVRARIDQSTTRTITGSTDGAGAATTMLLGVGGGMAIAASMDLHGGHVQTSTTHRAKHIVDIYTRDRRRIRCDSDKFNFDILGRKGLSDVENSERFALMLAQECRRALIDTSFKSFRCPMDVVSAYSRISGDATVVRRDDSPVFEFYSAWSACVHRAMLTP